MPPNEPSNTNPYAKLPQPAKWLLGIGIILLAVLLVFAAVHKTQPPANQPVATQKQTAQVTVSANGFSPQVLQVKAGTVVTWTNQDSAPHEIAPDPYPKNDSIPGMDTLQVLQTNDTYSFTFDKTGTYHYHDQLNPLKLLGTVKVQ